MSEVTTQTDIKIDTTDFNKTPHGQVVAVMCLKWQQITNLQLIVKKIKTTSVNNYGLNELYEYFMK